MYSEIRSKASSSLEVCNEKYVDYMESNDIYSKLNTNILEDPDRKYDILHDYIKKTRDTVFPVKYVKLANRSKHIRNKHKIGIFGAFNI